MQVIVKLIHCHGRFEIRDMGASGATMGFVDSVKAAKSMISGLVASDIKNCMNSNYDVADTTTGEIVYKYDADNSDEFQVDNIRAKIISLLRGQIDETLHARYTGVPNRFVLQRVSELSEILGRRLHPNWG